MRRAHARLRPALILVFLAWFAQFCLPVAHASVMSAPRTQMAGWCGDPSRARAVAAELPAEIREALELDGANTVHFTDCAKLCATGSTPTTTAFAITLAPRAAGIEPTLATRPVPRPRDRALTPPSQGPPARA